MSKLKFKFKNDEYEYQNSKNVLPISDIPLNLIPTGPPKTGEIYLRLVHEEAKKCPKVVRKSPPRPVESIITNKTKNINYLRKIFNNFEEEKEKKEKSNQLIPLYLKASKQWKDSFLNDFKNSRNIFNKKELPNNYIKETFPSLEDESSWKIYLYGKSNKEMKKLSTNSGEKEIILESGIVKKTEGRRPLLSIVKQMNQKIINKVIYYHSIWIQNSFTKTQIQWLYSLLIGLDPLLTSSQISILREICKLCKYHREELYKSIMKKTNNEELNNDAKNDLIEKVAPLNIIITIITVFFYQTDLE